MIKITCSLLAILTQPLFDLRQVAKRRRAHIGALREAEENRNDLAAIVGKRALGAGVIGQRKVPRVIGAGNVNAIEFLRAAAAATYQQ